MKIRPTFGFSKFVTVPARSESHWWRLGQTKPDIAKTHARTHQKRDTQVNPITLRQPI
jgi:hypothetical protein